MNTKVYTMIPIKHKTKKILRLLCKQEGRTYDGLINDFINKNFEEY